MIRKYIYLFFYYAKADFFSQFSHVSNYFFNTSRINLKLRPFDKNKKSRVYTNITNIPIILFHQQPLFVILFDIKNSIIKYLLMGIKTTQENQG